jgi:hypothetical protein
MMIAYWMKNEPVKSQVVSNRLSIFPTVVPSPVTQFAGKIRRVMPRSAIGRSRTAMKGGEN